MTTLTATFMGLIMAVPTAPALVSTGTAAEPVAHEVSRENWEIEKGDKVIVDTKNNIGYLYHSDGRYFSFEVVTGQRRYVSYIGRYYNASTPNWNWLAKTMDIKGDRLTFGPSGRFLRLYKDGDDRTAYGFHEYGQEEEIFNGMDTRFRSMGCVIVRTDMMDLIVNTWKANDEILPTKTVHGVEDLTALMKELNGLQEGTQNL